MNTYATSLVANAGAQSSKLVIGAASAQSVACVGGTVLVTPDTNCFFRMGANPVAVVDTDQILLANNSYRVTVSPGQKLAFIAAAAGNVYITQEA